MPEFLQKIKKIWSDHVKLFERTSKLNPVSADKTDSGKKIKNKKKVVKANKRPTVRRFVFFHYNDVILSAMAYQITSVSVVCSTVCSGADQRKHQSPASLAFVRGIRVNSTHKEPVTRKMFPYDGVIIMSYSLRTPPSYLHCIQLPPNPCSSIHGAHNSTRYCSTISPVHYILIMIYSTIHFFPWRLRYLAHFWYKINRFSPKFRNTMAGHQGPLLLTWFNFNPGMDK